MGLAFFDATSVALLQARLRGVHDGVRVRL